MSNQPSTAHKPKIPTYLPLAEAAEKFGLSKKVLTQMIQAGKIEAVQLPSGELLVAAENGNGHEPQTKEDIISVKFAHLRKQSITVTEAAEKYELPRSNILTWKLRGYISVLKEGYRLELDEADVAYCAYIYDRRQKSGTVSGSRIFDEEGNPYELKYPDLAQKRRKQD
jgi:predicted site-specific integrase-resolvase